MGGISFPIGGSLFKGFKIWAGGLKSRFLGPPSPWCVLFLRGVLFFPQGEGGALSLGSNNAGPKGGFPIGGDLPANWVPATGRA